MLIKIDDREPKSMEAFAVMVDTEICFLRQRMKTGDYVWKDVCIERKEINDFCGSIIDGRVESQAKKMLKDFKKVYFIIIGNIKDKTSNIHDNCLLGMISKLVVDYGISVLMVDNDWQFLYLMKRIFERHQEIDDKKMIEEALNEEK